MKAKKKRKPQRRTESRGNCYVTCEALYHLLGGKEAGYVPHRLRHEGDTHWYLVRTHCPCGMTYTHPVIVDPTASQFRRPPNYAKGVGAGFLTKKPSKRAQEMMKAMVWQ